MNDYLIFGGIAVAGALVLAFLIALAVARGNPAIAFRIWTAWVKKYWMYGVIVAAGIFAALVASASKRQIKKEVEEGVESAEAINVEADTIKAKISEVNSTAKAEIKVAKSKSAEKEKELVEIKKIEDPMERRKRLMDML